MKTQTYTDPDTKHTQIDTETGKHTAKHTGTERDKYTYRHKHIE